MFYQNAKSLYTFNFNFLAFALSGQTITKTEKAALVCAAGSCNLRRKPML